MFTVHYIRALQTLTQSSIKRYTVSFCKPVISYKYKTSCYTATIYLFTVDISFLKTILLL